MPRLEAYQNVGLPSHRDELYFNHGKHIYDDLEAIYQREEIVVGNSDKARNFFEQNTRDNTCVIVGAALGDEGKGRFVDNKIQQISGMPGVDTVYVIRYQGGSNAGHTVGINETTSIDLHQVPSGINHAEAVGIMDSGMIVNVDDLRVEVGYAEKLVGSLQDKLYLSHRALLNDDIDRAEEPLNRERRDSAKGGTGRGIGPTASHHLDKTGYRVRDLMEDNWEETFAAKYDDREKHFAGYGKSLAYMEVPDFESSHGEEAINRTVGTKSEYLSRLSDARGWLVERNMVRNTLRMHHEAFQDMGKGILFEGAQAIGLDAWLGTAPDVTATDTTADGVKRGTLFYPPDKIRDKIGILKIPYMSSVGNERQMPTLIPLGKEREADAKLPINASDDQKWAFDIRQTANEYGTTTGRPRDILHLDLEFIRYNAFVGGINQLAVTHLDIAKPDQNIKICTHYTNAKGDIIPYEPDLKEIKDAIPHYVTVPGWDGKACRDAKSFDDIPDNAKKFLALIQAQTGLAIIAATTGPKRDNYVEFKEFAA